MDPVRSLSVGGLTFLKESAKFDRCNILHFFFLDTAVVKGRLARVDLECRDLLNPKRYHVRRLKAMKKAIQKIRTDIGHDLGNILVENLKQINDSVMIVARDNHNCDPSD
jgi:hypothetical protein